MKKEMIGHGNSILVPLILAITGHRNIREQDMAPLENSVRSVFTDFTQSYPSTPLVLLSPLAEGADRLTARVALQCGAQLVVPLPMEQAEYEKDFQSPESLSEFRDLLAKAARVFTLPTLANQSREDSYAAVGAYIVRESQILVALWDGIEPGRIGGTAQVVKFKLHGIPEPYAAAPDILDPVDNGPVYHILTPRSSQPEVAGDSYSLKQIFPSGWQNDQDAAAAYAEIYRHIDNFNAEAMKQAESNEVDSSKEKLVLSKQAELLTTDEHELMGRYSIASALAIRFQSVHQRTLISLFGLAVLAFAFFEGHVHLGFSTLVLTGYPITLGIIWLIYRRAKASNHQDKYLDYRALAEGLRVQFYWLVAGLRDDVSDFYLRKQKSELDWIRSAIRGYSFSARSIDEPAVRQLQRDRLKIVAEQWVGGQLEYFINATERDHRGAHKNEAVVKRLFWAGLILAVAVVAIDMALNRSGPVLELRHLLFILMGLAPVVAAALDGYAEKTAFAAQAKKYRQMREIFEHAAMKLEGLLAADDLDTARHLIRELGKESLAENGEWVLMHRERPLHLPHAG